MVIVNGRQVVDRRRNFTQLSAGRPRSRGDPAGRRPAPSMAATPRAAWSTSCCRPAFKSRDAQARDSRRPTAGGTSSSRRRMRGSRRSRAATRAFNLSAQASLTTSLAIADERPDRRFERFQGQAIPGALRARNPDRLGHGLRDRRSSATGRRRSAARLGDNSDAFASTKRRARSGADPTDRTDSLTLPQGASAVACWAGPSAPAMDGRGC